MTKQSHMNEEVAEPEVPNRTQRRASKTRTRLLKAALSVFAETGADATTIEEITQRADLGKGTFYRHFADKNEIVGILIEQCVNDLIEAISRTAGQPHSLPGALDGLVNGHVEFFLGRQEEYLLLFQGRVLLRLDRTVANDLEQPYVAYLQRVEELVRPFVPQPVDSLKVRRLACAVAGFVSGYLSFAMITMEPQAIRESMEPMRGAFLNGMIGFMERRELNGQH